ncbi:transcriptional regulator [Microbacterium sp. NPDC080220]|uniref:GbsR/MarR family transcriptional regulator n=1 Tax=Microbacterium sp. NPDC080220 TaxID=3161017 RepID=UPI00342E5684
MDDGIAEFIESFGMAMDATVPRAAGRMLAWLLVCEPAEQSSEGLKHALHASAGGINQTVHLLMRIGFVERAGKRDRRTYYRVAPNAWEAVMIAQHAEAVRLLAMSRQGLHLLPEDQPARRARLAEMEDLYRFVEADIPRLMARYHAAKRVTGY